MLFLVAIFLLKNTSIFKNVEIYQNPNQVNGLAYGNATIEDLVNKDSNGNGIPDWQESLYGLDPTKKETTPGIPNSVAIQKIQAEQANTDTTKGTNATSQDTQNLTQTDQFSRELFATMAAANQNGSMDQTTIDALGASLAEKIQNPVVRKVFLTSDIKIIKDDSVQAFNTYFNTMNNIQAKYPIKESVTSILQKFAADENNVDTSVLVKLDEAITQTQNIINGILKVNVPQSLVSLHLDLLNAGERTLENVTDMKLFDKDPIVAMGAMGKYIENLNSAQSALNALARAINMKLKN